jgi:hypothetical protein
MWFSGKIQKLPGKLQVKRGQNKCKKDKNKVRKVVRAVSFGVSGERNKLILVGGREVGMVFRRIHRLLVIFFYQDACYV